VAPVRAHKNRQRNAQAEQSPVHQTSIAPHVIEHNGIDGGWCGAAALASFSRCNKLTQHELCHMRSRLRNG
jgi:hypothetical protein